MFNSMSLHSSLQMSAIAAQPRAKSCVECRQHKIRCDRLDRHPEPCSRCARRGLPCTYKAHFTREQRRQRQLQPKDSVQTSSSSAAANGEQTGRSSLEPDSKSRNHSSTSPAELSEAQSLRPCSASFLGQGYSSQPWLWSRYIGGDVAVEDMALTAEEVNAYYSYFFNHMHVNFPFLEQPFPITEALSNSPLLFWTILVVSCGFNNRPLYRKLQLYVQKLTAAILFPCQPSQATVQALCLLCMWPLEVEKPRDDPYFTYAGMATHMAMQLGLHRPDFVDEYIEIELRERLTPHSPRDRLSTWCACIFIEHHHAVRLGVPASTKDYWSLQQDLKDSSSYAATLDVSVRKQTLLAKLRDRFIDAIGWDGQTRSGQCEPAERLDLLRRFAAELDQFDAQHGPLDVFTSILFHVSHVVIAGWCLATDMVTLRDAAAERALLLRRGITSAYAVLDAVAPLAWETLPVHALRSILNAGVYIAQLLRIELETSNNAAASAQRNSHSSASTWGPSTSPTNDPPPSLGIGLTPDETQTMIWQLDRTIDLLRSVSYGKDFATRSKVVLEALRARFSKADSPPAIPLNLSSAQDRKTNWELRYNDEISRPSAGAPRAAGVAFQSRMSANIFWDAVNHGKGMHNWQQNSKEILSELQLGFSKTELI